ncbi:hypothetical protein LTR05_001240 [Lithohypha guttulata]|uniref:Uncharacterized protein n=2 Tax=Lithohypha guttulata TaxID=1690604 RepID=A0AAN7T7H8_9EURO|nr:hypothetical protein LTR05_001240 [Lithohypha guttulata]
MPRTSSLWLLLQHEALRNYRERILEYFSYKNPYLLSHAVRQAESSHRDPFTNMGNICSRSANKDDNFSGPGQTLGSSSDAPRPVPVTKKQTIAGTSGRPLGSAGGDGTSSPAPPDGARSAAARAAEERATAANKPGGKLSGQLAAQKKQTQTQTLNTGSEQERLARAADANTQARNWN